VLVPESGDSIQAMKAGLMEAADLFVINKADRPGAQRLAKEVEMMIHFRAGQALRNTPAHHGVDLSRLSGSGKAGTADRDRDRDRLLPEPGAARVGGAETRKTPSALIPRPAEGEAVSGDQDWPIPVLETIAETGKDVDRLVGALAVHRAWLSESGELGQRRRQRMGERVREVVRRRLMERVWRDGPGESILQESLSELESGATTPYQVAARIVRDSVDK
jgi:LAO/AO transport system kinase